MGKYRLSYLSIGGYKATNLEQLACLKDFDTTDIKVIDEFTSKFNNMDELISFLSRNILIERTDSLVITIDKKINDEKINKKIYHGENLIFANDKIYTNLSYIYRWLQENKSNGKVFIKIAQNYIEKYKNAYNRITGSSFRLDLFNAMLRIARKIDKIGYDKLTFGEEMEFEQCINDFIDLEFYKVDKEKYRYTHELVRVKDDKGNYIKNYRNIHDFAILAKSLNLDYTKYQEESIEEEKEYQEEFLTEDDFVPNGGQFDDSYKKYILK